MSAKEFFLEELPVHIAEMKRVLGDRVPKIDYDVEFEIDGEGMYAVVVKGGDASVRRGGAPDPLVAMRFAKATWDEALTRVIRPRMKKLAGVDPSAAEAFATKELARQLGGRKPAPPEQVAAAIKALPLRLLLEVPGTSHRFELQLAGAEEDDPTVTLTVAEPDIDGILSGSVSVQDAFKDGKLKLKGAVTTTMALLSRVFL